MTITQTVEIPDNHRLIIDVPREIPAGSVILTFTPVGTLNRSAKEPSKTADASDKQKYITQKLNEVYDDDYYKEFEPISNAALECVRETTKSDTW